MKIRIALIALTLFFTGVTMNAQSGEQLFKSNCAACHTVGKGKLTGPDLKKVEERHDMAWLVNWVKSSQSMVKAGDTSAVRLFKDYNNMIMPDQTLSDEEIKSVVEYIKTKGAQAAVTPPPANQLSSPAVAPVHENSGSMLSAMSFGEYLLLMMLCLIMLIVWVLIKTIRTLSDELKAKSH